MKRWRGLITEAAVVTAAGAILGYLSRSSRVADWLFAIGSAFLFWGGIRVLQNARLFAPVSWSFRQTHKILRNEKVSGRQMQEGYAEYRESRPRHSDAVPLMGIAGVLLALSVLLSFV